MIAMCPFCKSPVRRVWGGKALYDQWFCVRCWKIFQRDEIFKTSRVFPYSYTGLYVAMFIQAMLFFVAGVIAGRYL